MCDWKFSVVYFVKMLPGRVLDHVSVFSSNFILRNSEICRYIWFMLIAMVHLFTGKIDIFWGLSSGGLFAMYSLVCIYAHAD